MTHVSVVLPTYNERETILDAIQHARTSLRDAGYTPGVLVVDDDSPDGTHAHVREHYKHEQLVSVIHRTDRSGLASAVARGFRAAQGDIYAVMDADLQHPPDRLPDLVAPIEAGADLAVGSRFTTDGGIKDDWPVERRLISRGATWVANWELPAARRLSDPMSGFFAVDSTVVDPYETHLRAPGFKILLEVLARCPVKDVVEIGYQFRKRQAGESGLTSREYIRFVRHLARLSVAGRTRATTPEVTSGD